MKRTLLVSTALVLTVVGLLRAQSPGDQGVVTAPAKYTIDAWLSHKDAAGTEVTPQHIVIPAFEGITADFVFQPIRFSLPQLSPDQGDMEAYLQVLGTLNAVTGADGKITLSVSPSRREGLRRPRDTDGRPIMMAGNGSGSKVFTVVDNEAVAIELPAPSSGYFIRALTDASKITTVGGVAAGAGGGFSGGVAGARAGGRGGGGAIMAVQPTSMPAEPVSVTDGRMTLRTDLFFKGHQTTLTVRVRRGSTPLQ